MATSVHDNPDKSRYEVSVDGRPAGYAEYHLYQDLMAFCHTEIAPEFGGRGLATELIRYALDDAADRNLRVEPFCRFVRDVITKNHEYRELVPDEEWERFELA
jgi:predicted GNAT family acetyltransferase